MSPRHSGVVARAALLLGALAAPLAAQLVFAPPVLTDLGPGGGSFAAGDLDGDGLPDAVHPAPGASWPDDVLAFRKGDGAGGFGAPFVIGQSADELHALRFVDLDGDATPDLLCAAPGSPAKIVVFREFVGGSFLPGVGY